MKLYHGFRNFENILSSGKLLSPSLQSFEPTPLSYINPSLIRVAGRLSIAPFYNFNLSSLLNEFAPEISEAARNFFCANIPVEDVQKTATRFETAQKMSSDEFYRVNTIYFSTTPMNYTNFFVVDLPKRFVHQTKHDFPVIPGELSLDYVTNLLIEKKYEPIIKQILDKHSKSIAIETYVNHP